MNPATNPFSEPGPIQEPYKPISVLYLFRLFGSQAEYEDAVGKPHTPASNFDPTKPAKRWFDPDAIPGTLMTYPTIKLGAVGPNGVYAFTEAAYYLTGDDALAVNIPSDTDIARGGNALVALPIPMRPLAAGESLRSGAPGVLTSGVQVFNDALYAAAQLADAEASGKFLAEDRALLRAIAAKLGV